MENEFTPRRWSLRTRLFTGLTVLTLLTGALAILGVESARRMGDSLNRTTQLSARQVQLAGRLRSGFQEMRAHAQSGQIALVIQLLIRKHQESLDGYRARWQSRNQDATKARPGSPAAPHGAEAEPAESVPSCLSCHDDSMLNTQLQRFDMAGRTVTSQMDELAALAPRSVPLIQKMESSVGQWRTTYAEYVRLSTSGHFDDAHDLVTGRIFPILRQVEQSTSELEREANDEMQLSNRQGMENLDLIKRLSAVLAGISILVTALAFGVVHRSTLKLKSLTIDLISVAGHLFQTGNAVTASGVELERGAAAQASSLAEASNDTCQARRLASDSAVEIASARKSMDEASQRSASADSAVVSLQQAMTELDGSTRLIAGTLRSINEIAFQTNLLALNASVEAARAGQAGLGFAVVAGEIRTLAERCTEAASETAALVQQIQERSQAGRSRLDIASGILQGIQQSTGSASSALIRISDSIAQQSAGTSEADVVIRKAAAIAARNNEIAGHGRRDAEEVLQASGRLNAVIVQIDSLVGSSDAHAATGRKSIRQPARTGRRTTPRALRQSDPRR